MSPAPCKCRSPRGNVTILVQVPPPPCKWHCPHQTQPRCKCNPALCKHNGVQVRPWCKKDPRANVTVPVQTRHWCKRAHSLCKDNPSAGVTLCKHGARANTTTAKQTPVAGVTCPRAPPGPQRDPAGLGTTLGGASLLLPASPSIQGGGLSREGGRSTGEGAGREMF